MTGYSVLSAGKGHTIVATWAAVPADRTIKITTVDQEDTALEVAWELSRLSENAWQGVMWLDCAPELEAWVAELVAWLRSDHDRSATYRPGVPLGPVPASLSRHGEAEPFAELAYQAGFDLPDALNGLTSAQRRTVADEIEADAAERTTLTAGLRSGAEPADASRGWQAFHVGRVTGAGRYSRTLIDSGPAWLERHWPGQDLLVDRWASRGQLLRLDQLAAAARAAGGEGVVEDEPVQADGWVPAAGSPSTATTQVPDVFGAARTSWRVWPGGKSRLRPGSYAPMIVSRDGFVVGEVAPDDDAGFVELLGEWAAGAGGNWWAP